MHGMKGIDGIGYADTAPTVLLCVKFKRDVQQRVTAALTYLLLWCYGDACHDSDSLYIKADSTYLSAAFISRHDSEW